jgi:hypothetical protein
MRVSNLNFLRPYVEKDYKALIDKRNLLLPGVVQFDKRVEANILVDFCEEKLVLLVKKNDGDDGGVIVFQTISASMGWPEVRQVLSKMCNTLGVPIV